VTWSQHLSEYERKQRINDFVYCILYKPTAELRHLSIIEVLAAFISNIVFVNTLTPHNERQQSVNTASTERQQSINTVSTLLGVASCIFKGLCYGICPSSTYWQPFCPNAIVTWSQHLSENEPQENVNDFVCWTFYKPRAVLRHSPIIGVLAAFIGNIVCVNAATPQASMEPPLCLVL